MWSVWMDRARMGTVRRLTRPVAWATMVAAALLAACGGGGGGGDAAPAAVGGAGNPVSPAGAGGGGESPAPVQVPAQVPQVPAAPEFPASRAQAARFLTQATFGPTEADIDRV